MENKSIASTLRTIATLYELDGKDSHKIIALRTAAAHLAESEFAVADQLDDVQSIPGIGASTAHLIRDIVVKGPDQVVERLDVDIPRTLPQLLGLRGLGPKTARRLYVQFGIASLTDLTKALETGKLRQVTGFGPKKLAQLRVELRTIERRRRLLPIADAWPLALDICEWAVSIPGVLRCEPTGSARRLETEVERVECVASVTDPLPLQQAAAERGMRVSEDGSDVTGHLEVDVHEAEIRIYLAAPARFVAQWMETTGDNTHVEVLRRMAQQHGIHWAPSGDLAYDDGSRVELQSEETLYELLGMPWYPPELREGRGVLQNPAELVALSDIRGDLHAHSNWSDGSVDIKAMVQAAAERGYQFVAITDHSQSLSIAGGLTPDEVRRQAEVIREVRAAFPTIHILHGMEVDILADGRLDMPDDVLWELDIVIASIHSHMRQPKDAITDRLLQAIRHPAVDIIGHMSGRVLGRRDPYPFDFDTALSAAAESGTMFELNANPHRLDLSDEYLRQAAEAGVTISINTDAHYPSEFAFMGYGIRMARRGWLKRGQVLNTLPFEELQQRLHKVRSARHRPPHNQTR